MIQRIAATLWARNLEFLRDRSTLGWNFVLPFLLVIGLSFAFSGGAQNLFKVAVLTDDSLDKSYENLPTVAPEWHPFLTTRYTQFYTIAALEPVIKKVERHQVDMLLDLRQGQQRYWINNDSPKGYILELLLKGSGGNALSKQDVSGEEVRYVDWVLPGILGMNLMFSCLFGVGFVIVRYRKNGYLKRLNATPLTATEFLIAQIISRLLLVVITTIIVFIGSNWAIGFIMEGHYLTLFLVLVVGAFSMITLGLLVAARVNSEELAGGLLNVITWPMMMLSGVWFSMEGAHPLLQGLSQIFPLTHMLDAARAVMLDGAGVWQIMPDLLWLTLMGAVFLFLGALSFKWTAD